MIARHAPWRYCALVGLMLCALALLSAARCGPAGTRTVIFVQGLYTSLDDAGTQTSFVEDHRFDALKRAFIAAKYKPDQLLDYSYIGGSVTAQGAWQPKSYDCPVTDRKALESVAVLETMVRDYRKKHSKAHITLVGHSLGGYIAFLAGVRESQRPKGQRIGIDGVVTLDSPLGGASADKKVIIDLIPCDKTYVAGAELLAVRNDASTPDKRRAEARAMAAAGVRLATLGNLGDCLWNTARCIGGGWVDDTATQFVDTAELSKPYGIASEPLKSHDAILIDPAVDADVVSFVGNP